MATTPHGSRGYAKGCHCDICRAAHAADQRVYMQGHPEQREKARQRALRSRGKDPALTPPRKPIRHGGMSGLNQHKRRSEPPCSLCQAFLAAKRMVAEAKKAESLRPCGTLAAVRRHYRKGEPLCNTCREFVRANARARRSK